MTKHFTLKELIISQEAARKGIDNSPAPEVEANLHKLCLMILEPLRELLGEPVLVTSGYRSPELNAAIGGSSTSQHMTGQAADIHANGLTSEELFQTIVKSSLPFDQVIEEFGQWVHVSYSDKNQRGQKLIAKRIDGKTKYLTV